MISGAVGPGDHEQRKSSLWLVSILGGAPRRLRGDAVRASVSPDDSLVVYMSRDGIWLADADGGNPREFISKKDWEEIGSPRWSPDGKRVVYRRLAPTGDGMVQTIESRALDENTSIVLVREENPPRLKEGLIWMRDFLMLEDRLIYSRVEPAPRSRDENLWEIAVVLDTGRPAGEPRRLTDWVDFTPWDLSASADGSQLALLNNESQADVYVGELGDGGRSLEGTRRLTLDDRDDVPACWTPDGRVVIASNRYGNLDLLAQGLDRREPRDLVRGAGDQAWAVPTPDGEALLYWESEEGRTGPNVPQRLLRVPVGGGPTELVLETQGRAQVHCATAPGGPCVLIEDRIADGVSIISRLDPVAGKTEELWRFDRNPGLNPIASLSPDGGRFAVVGHTKEQRSIRLRDAFTGEILREIEMEGMLGASLVGVAWRPDGDGFYVISDFPRGMAMLHVDLRGKPQVLFEDPTGFLLLAIPSPDGRYLAFGKVTVSSNAWMIEQF